MLIGPELTGSMNQDQGQVGQLFWDGRSQLGGYGMEIGYFPLDNYAPMCEQMSAMAMDWYQYGLYQRLFVPESIGFYF